jgi:four helix bundle protein
MNYEKLEVWQRSVEVSVQVYQLLTNSRDFGFKDQICRSAVSVPSNIAEGCERIHLKEKVNFLSIAKGSVGELKTQLIIGGRIGHIPAKNAEQLIAECETLSRMIGALISHNKNKI